MSLAARWLFLAAIVLPAAGCNSSQFDAPEVEGRAAMIDDAGQPRLWVLSKQEETRQIAVGGGTSRYRWDWRSDTFFHCVWLLIGEEPIAVSAEARHYGFDNGLVLMSADARQFGVRGDKLQAQAYAPPPPPSQYPKGQMLANGREELVPMLPLGESSPRQGVLGGEWIGLYSEKEVADIADDDAGKTLRYPYSVIDAGSLARRTFWRAKIATVRQFDDKYQRLAEPNPIAGAPIFLKGRFITEPGSDQPAKLEGRPGLLVLHSTRMDAAGNPGLRAWRWIPAPCRRAS